MKLVIMAFQSLGIVILVALLGILHMYSKNNSAVGLVGSQKLGTS